MYLYEMSDINETITNITKNENYDIQQLHNAIVGFFASIDSELTKVVLDAVIENSEMNVTADELLKTFTTTASSTTLTDEDKRNILTEIANSLAECADMEEYCENKIFVVLKNLANDGSAIVREYNSYDEARKDVDEWYTSCCDDVFIGENVLYPILCSVISREWDYFKNFCTVLEFNAQGIEDARESWEAENCEPD